MRVVPFALLVASWIIATAPPAAPAPAAEPPDLKAEFLALCDAGCTAVRQQATLLERRGRAFYWDSYVVRGLCAAYDMTGKQEYLDASKAWCDGMIAFQNEMIPKGAYYMQYGRTPGEATGDWYVADCSSIGLGVLATAIRCQQPAEKQKYLNSVLAFARLVADNWVRPSGGVTDGYWPKSDKEWWCSTGIYGSLAFCLYDETRDPRWLQMGLGTIDWLNQQDLLNATEFFPPREIKPTVLMYCLEAYSAALPHLERGTARYEATLKQLDVCRRWMAENFGGRAGIPYVAQWGSKFGGLPFHLYVQSRHVPQGEELIPLADVELQFIAAAIREAAPSNQRDQLALFALLSYAEKLSPGTLYRTSHQPPKAPR